MRLLFVLCGVGTIAFAVCGPRHSAAQVLPQPPAVRMFSDMLSPAQQNETGFTLGEIIDRHLWLMARHPLATNAMGRVGADAHRAPLPGIQFELLTPGDFGATVHFRW